MRDSDRAVRLAQAAGRAGLTGADLRTGCVLVGPPRSGRSTALAALRERCQSDVFALSGVGRTADRVFSEVLGRPASGDLRWELAHRLADVADPVLCVDDADLLDDDAAAVLYALVVHDGIPTFVTCATEGVRASPSGLSALWRDGHLPRFDLRELTLAEADEYVRCRLDAVPELQNVSELLAQAGGNTADFVDLVDTSIAAGCWEPVPGAMLMVRPPPVSGRLRDAVAAGTLAPSERDVLVLLAAAAPDTSRHSQGWLPLSALLATSDLDTLVSLESRGLIESNGRHVRIAVPALADAVSAQVAASAVAVAATTLGAAISSAGLTGVEAARADLLGVLLTRRGGGAATGEAVLAAARGAIYLGDPQAALDVIDADSALTETMPAVQALAARAALYLGDPAEVAARMTLCTDPADQNWSTITSVLADQARWDALGPDRYLRAEGDTADVVREKVAAMRTVEPVTAAWRGLNCCVAAALLSKERIARAALEPVLGRDYGDATLSIYLECADIMTGVLIGDAIDSGELADRLIERHRWRSARTREVVGFIAGLVYLEVGRIEDADAQLGKGQRWWSSDDSGATPTLTLSLHVRRRAWRLADGDDVAGAVELLARAVAAAIESGHRAVAVEYLELLLRFDSCYVVDDEQIAVLTAGDSLRAELGAAYALAGRRGDGDALDRVAERYASSGRLPVAADVSAHAAMAHQRRGHRRASAASARSARDRAASMAGYNSPAQQLLAAWAGALSHRERQVAMLTDTLTNREIAERLGLSVRTVEGHVLRACEKAGVNDRVELAGYAKAHRL